MRLGIDYGGTNIKFGIFTEEGSVVAFEKKSLEYFINKGNLLSELTDYAARFISGKPVDRGGFCIKGLVMRETGIMVSDVGAGELFKGINIRKALSSKLHIPIVVDNDARAYTWGEWRFGAGAGLKNMVCVTLGTGIGTSRIVNGKLFFGENPLEGLLGGHLSICKDGPECPCGNRGCLEYYCSATGLAREIKEAIPELESEEDVLPVFFRSFEENHLKYKLVLDRFIDNLTIGLVNIIHAYQPEVIVLGGGLMKSSHFIIPDLLKNVRKRAWTNPRGKIKIRAAKMIDKAASMGIAFYPELENDYD